MGPLMEFGEIKMLEQEKLEKAAVRKLEEMEKMQELDRSHKNKDRGVSR